jgi:hypothetical protein
MAKKIKTKHKVLIFVLIIGFVVISYQAYEWNKDNKIWEQSNSIYIGPNKNIQITKPRPGIDKTYGFREIQYCLYYQIRIDTINEIVTSKYAISILNGLIDEYNTLCGEYKYRRATYFSANTEIERIKYVIISEAKDYAYEIEQHDLNSVDSNNE